MSRTIKVPLHYADLYHDTLKSAVLEGLEPYPGRPGWPFATGLCAEVEYGRVNFRSHYHAWWISGEDNTISCGSMTNDVSPEVQKHCAHVAFATVGDNRSLGLLRVLLPNILELNEGGPGCADFDVLFFRHGILAHFSDLSRDLVCNISNEDRQINEGLCRSGIAAICPEHTSRHESMTFLGDANAYIARKLKEELSTGWAYSYRAHFDDLAITFTP